MRNFKPTLLILLFANFGFSQTIATSGDGVKIKLNKDKTWEYLHDFAYHSVYELESDACSYMENKVDEFTDNVKLF